MPINMGMGKLGSNQIIHKRKFRWTFEVLRFASGDDGRPARGVPASFVKVAARPNLNIEETEINFLNAKRFIPGKGTWETVTITYYDVAADGDDATNIGLWDWLASVYDYTGAGTGSVDYNNYNPNVRQSSKRECYTGTGVLILYDGCGNALEKWQMLDCWPQAVNFGELDYSVSEEVTIEVTLRYGGVTYQSYCDQNPRATCCGCENSSGANSSLPAGFSTTD